MHSIIKTKFFFASRFSLKIACWLKAHPFPFLSTRTLSGLFLCRPCMHCYCLYRFIYALLFLEDTVSLEPFIPSGSYNLSTFLLFSIAPWTLRASHLGLAVSKSLTLCPILGLCISSIYYKRKLFWWWLSKTLIYGDSKMSSGDILLLFFLFSLTIVFGFPLHPCPIESQVLGHWNSVRHGFQLVEWALTIQRVVSHSHNVCATIAPAYHAGRSLLQTVGFLAWLMNACLLWKHAEFPPVSWTLTSQ